MAIHHQGMATHRQHTATLHQAMAIHHLVAIHLQAIQAIPVDRQAIPVGHRRSRPHVILTRVTLTHVTHIHVTLMVVHQVKMLMKLFHICVAHHVILTSIRHLVTHLVTAVRMIMDHPHQVMDIRHPATDIRHLATVLHQDLMATRRQAIHHMGHRLLGRMGTHLHQGGLRHILGGALHHGTTGVGLGAGAGLDDEAEEESTPAASS
mmetsp:Transcript_125666/g.228825  ORF Transcript_125666/g.228825 Transcript_125666/m.228825 type:complete len:207 (+) Transcript_125666:319-939(+)